MNNKKYVKFKGENTMVAIACVFFVGFLLSSFIGKAVLQSDNSELQRLKSKKK